MGARSKGNTGAKMRYYNIKRGKVTSSASESTPKAVPVANGKYEIHDDDVIGIVVKALYEKSEDEKYSGHFVLMMKDDEGLFQVSMGWGSGYMMNLLSKHRNIDFAKEIVLEPYSFEQEGKFDKTRMGVYQNDKKIVPFFSKDEPGDVPPAIAPSGPGEKWDFSAQTKFLKDDFMKKHFPTFGQTIDADGWIYGSDANRVVAKEEEPAHEDNSASLDNDNGIGDLPF